MKVNVKEVDIFKKMGNDDGDREGRLQQMTHQANLILQKANDEKRDYLVRALTKSVETNTKIRGSFLFYSDGRCLYNGCSNGK